MRVEIRLAVVVSLRPKGAAFGQAGSTRLDPTLARTEGTLEWNQPEERHGFLSKNVY